MMAAPIEQALATLGAQLPNLASLEAYWREKAPGWHPDHGGSAEDFAAKLAAYRTVKAHFTDVESKCPACRGVGKTVEKYGFTVLHLVCSVCRGSGKRKSIA